MRVVQRRLHRMGRAHRLLVDPEVPGGGLRVLELRYDLHPPRPALDRGLAGACRGRAQCADRRVVVDEVQDQRQRTGWEILPAPYGLLTGIP